MVFMYIGLCTPPIQCSGIRNAKANRHPDPRMDKGRGEIRGKGRR